MRIRFVYALRNLMRHPRRSIMLVMTVCTSVALTMIASSYADGIMTLWERGLADTGAGHVQVQVDYAAYADGDFSGEFIAESIAQKLRQDERVVWTSSRLDVEGVISSNRGSQYFLGRGLVGEDEARVSPRLFTDNDEGKFVSATHTDGAVIGKGLAEGSGFEIGDEMSLIAQTVTGSVNAIDVTVVGIVDAGIPSFSQRIIMLPLAKMQRLIRQKSGVSSIVVRLHEGVDIYKFVDEWRKKNPSHKWLSYNEVQPIVPRIKKIWVSLILLLTSLLFLTCAVSILNIVYVMVGERVVEIGTLSALGAKPRAIERLFLLEATLLGAVGGLVGEFIGLGVIGWLGQEGIPFQNPFGADRLLIYPQVQVGFSLALLAAAIFVSCVASYLPARKGAACDPVVAFRALQG